MTGLWLGLGVALSMTVPQAAGGGDGGGGVVPRAPAEDSCGATALQHLVGEPVAVIDTIVREGPMRVHAVSDMITMDYNPARLNVVTDPARETIVRIHCG
jgi:hypothetical protein